MLKGKKYINKDVNYVSFKKHFCPNCSTKLKTVKVSKTVNFFSPEAKDFDFSFSSLGHNLVVNDDIEFSWKEFDCPSCKTHFTVNELKKIEGIDLTHKNTDEENKSKATKGWILFYLVGILFALIIVFFARI